MRVLTFDDPRSDELKRAELEAENAALAVLLGLRRLTPDDAKWRIFLAAMRDACDEDLLHG